ncbi:MULTISPECIES: Crp/Fnr family transcriptional regulator [unclassified Methylobacterium]|uniref:Crp/Fnr family transcriptional regulator n=1 Tax=unclassified Methylobacterium TaxID=2615210 RepID=UPI001FBBFB66|nr:MULTISPECIES: Crp/Fnr family transcriptional regulator [unclassified Methylobacterium]MCJ2012445.1 Crp/Fnr family transcriptional regulator [Methylobacterium sp. J-076]MCJ2024487.1 Crp/Fnr family transcriptional regulator [Methylobacterium sp. J-067]
MSNPLIMKLEHGAQLTDEDRAVLQHLTGTTRRVARHMDISPEGERPEDVHLVMQGFACRYKTLRDGRRQIMAFLAPGDFCDLHVAILGEMDHSIGTGWGCTIVDIPRSTIEDLTAHHPRITRALWWATLVDEGTLRAWLVNMGQCEADRQMAHLICELHVRLRVVGLAGNDSFEFPITQEDLADTLGITNVHVNRVLQDLRAQGLVEWKSKRVRIPDVERLRAFAEFDPKYLHLNRRSEDERPFWGTP